MPVTFNEIPQNILTPGHFVEVDASQAGGAIGVRENRALIIGMRAEGGTQDTVTLPTATAGAEVAKRITRASEADDFFGRAFTAAETAKAFLDIAPNVELWVMGVNQPAAGTQAEWEVTFGVTGTPVPGEIPVYVAGRRYAVPVAADDTATTLGDSFVALVNADEDCLCTGANLAGTVTLTAKWKGIEGNDIDVRKEYRGTDTSAFGTSCSISATVVATGTTDLSSAIAAIGATQYHTIVSAYADDTSVDNLEAELRDRWGPMPENDGHLFVGFCGSLNSTTTYTAAPARNSEQSTVACAGASPTPPWIVAADVAAIDANMIDLDPALPRTGKYCEHVDAPEPGDRWTRTERNQVLDAGGTTLLYSGAPTVERIFTTYQTTPSGATDTAYRDLSRKRTVSYLRWSWDNWLTRKFQRFKLADDGTRFGPGQAVVTPRTLKSEAVSWFETMESIGLVEDIEQFKQDLVVERSITDANRIDMILAPNTIEKFVVSATKLQFR